MTIDLPIKRRMNILSLGAESAGVFAVYSNGKIFISENFGDLLNEDNFVKYKKAVLTYLRKEKIKPDVILTDLHPLYNSAIFGAELAKKYSAQSGSAAGGKVTKLIKIQHHIAHIFSALGDYFCHPEFISGSELRIPIRQLADGMTESYKIPNTFFGIAMDGTGYGLDGNIWGGEVFRIQFPISNFQISNKSQIPNSKIKVERIGSLEEQIMIGGDLAVREPARMLIAILAKIPNPKSQFSIKSQIQNPKNQKEFIYKFIKKYYTQNEFELFYNQLEQRFNCQITTSTGRVLDAVSVLLGFAGNERGFKHEATKKLEENSSKPYFLEPKISFSVIASELPSGDERGNLSTFFKNKFRIRERLLRRSTPRNDKRWILQTTPLFKYLIKNIHKDKKRLAATAQLYIIKGLYEIIKNHDSKFMIRDSCFAAGGMASNKIISSYMEKQGVYLAKKILRGDEGIAIGQIFYYLLNGV